jgi:hypothetical protein
MMLDEFGPGHTTKALAKNALLQWLATLKPSASTERRHPHFSSPPRARARFLGVAPPPAPGTHEYLFAAAHPEYDSSG